MSDLIATLAAMSEQRAMDEVAAECDAVFADRHGNSGLEIPGKEITFCVNSLRAAIDFVKDNRKNAMWVLGEYYSVVYPDARLGRSVRLYQEVFGSQ